MAPLVLVGTLAVLVLRPLGAREWQIALIGAAAAVLLGTVQAADALEALVGQIDLFLFFIGLMTVAAIADQSGVVARLTAGAATAARGRRDVLLVLVGVLAIAVTATLSNDATVLVLTPLVIDLARRLGASPLPYALACAYLANAASAILPIANPANVILLHSYPVSLLRYLVLFAVPSLLAAAATIAVLLVQHRRLLGGPLQIPPQAAHDPDSGVVAIAIGVLVAWYLLALAIGYPVGVVAAVGGAAFLMLRVARGRFQRDRFMADMSWGIFPLLAGFIVLVRAVERGALLDGVASGVAAAAAAGPAGLALLAGLSALASDLLNNLPVALLVAGGLAGSDVPDRAAAAMLIGIDVGPSFTILGSMATVLWLFVLRRRGMVIGAWEYVRWSFVPTLAALVAALAGLALMP